MNRVRDETIPLSSAPFRRPMIGIHDLPQFVAALSRD